MRWRTSCVLGLLGFLYVVGNADGLAVMSIDLGSEWMKIGIVSPGVPMEVVLNKESKRKTPIAISFRDGERLIGEDALTVGVRFPKACYSYFLDLLGKKMDNPMVKLFQQRFPHYELVADEERGGTVLFKHDESTLYSPEELLGMILSRARDFAQEFSKQPVREAVITVPPFFNQAERRAVLNAAELSGVKVLQLINSNTAAALNYGIFRRKDFNETAQYIILYDMGASSTVATVVSYQIAKTKEKGMVETNPQLSILGVGYDRTLGGLEMQSRLRNHLAKTFNEMKKTNTDIFTNHRSMAKLLKEAGRVKNVLSANADHYAQVEGLLDEKDFRTQITREQFENLNQDLFERVQAPIVKALEGAGMTLDMIDQVILVGAGTRVPKVQEKLVEYVKRELGKSLNTDEAAALGAVYKAADLSTGFKVKKFITKDAVIFPILVDFEREVENEDGSKTVKIIRRTLFSHMNPFPQKKILTFNKHVEDFTYYVSYGEMPVSKEEALAVGSVNISKVELSGVASALQQHGNEGESKGVKAHFHMDESGILTMTLVEAVFEKNSTEGADSVGDTLSKIGSAFSNLFGGSDDAKKEQDAESETNEGASSAEQTDTEKPANETNKTKEEPKPAEDKQNTTASNTTSTSTSTEKKTKVVQIKEKLGTSVKILDVSPLDGEKFKKSAEKLKNLDDVDRVRAQREKTRNVLETFVIDMQNNIYSDEYEKAVTEEEKEKILKLCSETSDWLYEEGFEAEKSVYEEKLKALRSLTKDLLERVKEHKDRPEALEALNNMINISTQFLEKSKSLPEEDQLLTDAELSVLEKLITETVTWKETKVKEQEATALSAPPVLTIRSIAEKIEALDREVKYTVNKARLNKLNKERAKAEAKAKEAAANKTEETEKSGDKTKESSEAAKEKQPKTEENVIDDSSKPSSNESTPGTGEGDKESVKPSKSEPNAEDPPHTEL